MASGIVKALASDAAGGVADESWKVDFLRGLTKVRRFGMAAAFMDDSEKADLKAIFGRAREALARLEREWEL